MRLTNFSLSHLSIKHRLPLLIGTLLLGVILAATVASYRGVKESALEVGNERLQSLTKQLSNLLQQSAAAVLAQTFTVANDPAIRAVLQSPSPTTRSAASATLEQFKAPKDPLGFQVELWDTKRSLVLSQPNGALQVAADLETEFKASSVEPFKSAGPMHLDKNAIVVPTIAAVKDELGKPLGYLVRWRRVSLNPQPKQLTDLIGSDAALYFGNSRGDIFTNLERIVAKPQPNVGSTLDIMHYSRDGNRVMAHARPIVGTPWFLLVEFPEQPFMTQANRFLRRIILIDIVLFTIGMVGAFTLSRSITRPLNRLTGSVAGISGGDYSGKIRVRRNDELGVLGNAFNLMVAKVRDSQVELEQKVQALGESEDRLQTVIENLSEGLIVANLNGQLLNCNRAAWEMQGFASLDDCLLNLSELGNIFELSDLDGAILSIEQWPLARIIRSEVLRNYEVRIRRINADWNRVFNCGGSIVREASGKLIAVVTMTDITERKLAEEELRQTNLHLERTLVELQIKTRELASMTQQLWQASKLATMGELAASVAHELNNPLATISLRLESLADQLALDGHESRAVEIVTDEVERMGRLVGSLLEFSRRGHPQISTIDVSEEIEKSVELIEYYLRSHKIDVIQDFEADLPTIQADHQQLRQVFLNLLANASDAMPEGGKLVARTRNARFENGLTGVSIEFVDAGQGIAPDDLDKIWEPFFTTKPEGKGTGLGLAICRRVIEEHHGKIAIKSRLGEGTTVTIFLPATNGEEEQLDLKRDPVNEFLELTFATQSVRS